LTITPRSDKTKYLELAALSCFHIVHLTRQQAIGSLKNELLLHGNWRSTLHVSRWHIAMPDVCNRTYIRIS